MDYSEMEVQVFYLEIIIKEMDYLGIIIVKLKLVVILHLEKIIKAYLIIKWKMFQKIVKIKDYLGIKMKINLYLEII